MVEHGILQGSFDDLTSEAQLKGSPAAVFLIRRRLGGSMIEELHDLPAGVTGFQTSGKLESSDFRDTVLPALERAFANGEVRLLIVLTDFTGITGGAVWEDLKLGVETYGVGGALPSLLTSSELHT